MKKVLILFGSIHFEESNSQPISAEITDLKDFMYVEEEKAEKLGQYFIEQNVVEGYLIPSMYKGKIIFNC